MSIAEGTYVSLAFEALGDRSNALEALSRITPRGVDMTMALRDIGFDGMRTDARFRRVTAVVLEKERVAVEKSSASAIKRLVGSVPP